ncbi:unnamed protein product [Timema podura]|uniref:Uncharacterized protein n=1 Tax=Timema podura TaxID=61482 RepID=A0ABN7NXG1_TIMPD|nr:unnamed protein product [Timema podura]
MNEIRIALALLGLSLLYDVSFARHKRLRNSKKSPSNFTPNQRLYNFDRTISFTRTYPRDVKIIPSRPKSELGHHYWESYEDRVPRLRVNKAKKHRPGGRRRHIGTQRNYSGIHRAPAAAKINQGTVHIFKNLGDSLNVIETPDSPYEESLLEELRDFLNNKEHMSNILGDTFDYKVYKTKGDFLKGVLGFLFKSNIVKNRHPLYETVKKYLNKNLNTREARQPNHYLGLRQKEKRNLDVNGLFKAFDRATIKNDHVDDHLEKVLEFFAFSLNPGEHLKGFNAFKYETRGEVLSAMLDHLLSLESIPSEEKESMTILFPYILMSGAGEMPAFTEA